MPIVVQHQPPFSRLGQLAFRTGQLQYADRRRQEEERRLMQERQMAHQQNMQDQRVAVDVWGRQFGQLGALQRMAIGAQQQFQRDQMQQQFQMDRIDVGHQNLVKINEMQNLNQAERDLRLDEMYQDRQRLSDDLMRGRNEEDYRRRLDAMKYQSDLNTGQIERSTIAKVEGQYHQRAMGGMTLDAQEAYKATMQQEYDVRAAIRSNEINEEQGMQQLEQIQQERSAVRDNSLSYVGKLAPGDSIPSPHYPGYRMTRNQDGTSSHFPDMTEFQHLPKEEQDAAWGEKYGREVIELPDGSLKVRILNKSNPSEFEEYDIESPEAIAMKNRESTAKNARIAMDAINEQLKMKRDALSEIESLAPMGAEGLAFLEADPRAVKLRESIRDLEGKLETNLNAIIDGVTSPAAPAAPVGEMAPEVLDPMGAPEIVEAAPPGMPAGMAGMPIPRRPEGAPQGEGLIGKGGRVVPHREAFVQHHDQPGGAVVDAGAPAGSAENPHVIATTEEAANLDVGQWFENPDGQRWVMTPEMKRSLVPGWGQGADLGAAGVDALLGDR